MVFKDYSQTILIVTGIPLIVVQLSYADQDQAL